MDSEGSDSDNESDFIPPEMIAAAKEINLKSLPDTSKMKYIKVYNEFKNWRSTKKIRSFAECILLMYFNEISTKYAASTLWSKYSMLKTTIKTFDNVNMHN